MVLQRDDLIMEMGLAFSFLVSFEQIIAVLTEDNPDHSLEKGIDHSNLVC